MPADGLDISRVPVRPALQMRPAPLMRRDRVRGIAIDSTKTVMRDDAVWASERPGGWRVEVSMPDIAHGDRLGAALRACLKSDREARAFLGLKAGDEVPAITISLDVEPDRGVVGYFARRTRLTVQAAITDRQFELGVREGGSDASVLRVISDVARELRRAQMARLGREGDAAAPLEGASGAVGIIESLCLSANLAATEALRKAGWRLIYSNMGLHPAELGTGKWWSTEAHGHRTIGVPAYATFTSPLWRPNDLANLRILAHAVHGLEEPYDPEALGKIAEIANSRHGGLRSYATPATGVDPAPAYRMELSGLSASPLLRLIRRICLGEPVPEGMDAEILRRVRKGTLPLQGVATALAHPNSPFSPEVRSEIIGLLRGLGEPRLFKTIIRHMANMSIPSRLVGEGVLEDLPDGTFEFRQEIEGLGTIVGRGATPYEARLEMLCKELALLSGLTDAPDPIPGAVLSDTPQTQLAKALGRFQVPPPRITCRTLPSLVIATVQFTLPGGRTITAVGRHGDSLEARELAATEALLQLGKISPPRVTKKISEVSPDDVVRSIEEHAGDNNRYDRALEAFCDEMGLPDPQIDFLASEPGTSRARVSLSAWGETFVAVEPGDTQGEAAAEAALQVLAAISIRLEAEANAEISTAAKKASDTTDRVQSPALAP